MSDTIENRTGQDVSTEVTVTEAMQNVDIKKVGDRGHAVVVIAATTDGELSMRTNVAGNDLFEVLGMAMGQVVKDLHGAKQGAVAVKVGGGRRAVVRTSDHLCGHIVGGQGTPEKCPCPPDCVCRETLCKGIPA